MDLLWPEISGSAGKVFKFAGRQQAVKRCLQALAMKIPFQTIDWNSISSTEHKGETGKSFGKTIQFEGLRLRIVEYSKGYLADHWCKLGHIVHCLEGEFISELENGERFILTKGMTYIVSNELSSHRSYSENGVKLLIIDGDFLSVK